MGVNTAIPYDVVKVNNHYGAVYELVACKSISRWILDDPDNIDEYIDEMVKLTMLSYQCMVISVVIILHMFSLGKS